MGRALSLQRRESSSFTVNDPKGFFHDFSSGKHGDGFAFLMETEGISFPEAVERLAGMAGLPMPVETSEQRESDRKRASLTQVMDWAAEYFQRQLKGGQGGEARDYLARREISPAAQAHFRIGYAPPDRHGLRDALAARGVGVDAMIEAGLLIHGEEIAVPYDRFRHRLMFPIQDRGGAVIAFGGRALEKDAQAKYLNSPETPLFHKGATLYNLHNARKAAHEAGTVIAVEGYIDVIAMTAAGLAHVVAPLGTALTPEQCALLWRMAEEPILCFDGDKAGLKAADRAIDTALPLIEDFERHPIQEWVDKGAFLKETLQLQLCPPRKGMANLAHCRCRARIFLPHLQAESIGIRDTEREPCSGFHPCL